MAVTLSNTQQHVATVMAQHHAKTATIVAQLGINKLGAQRAYKEVHGVNPKSGLPPSSTDTVWQPIQRMHISLLLMTYEAALARLTRNDKMYEEYENYNLDIIGKNRPSSTRLKALKEHSTLIKAKAFTSAYTTYCRITGKPDLIVNGVRKKHPESTVEIDINRFNHSLKEMYKVSSINTPKKIIQWGFCSGCRAKLVRRFDYSNQKCAKCENSLTRSRTLKNSLKQKRLEKLKPPKPTLVSKDTEDS